MAGIDFDTPVMYQDLANSTMGPIMPFGGVPSSINTSYLGGVQMKQQLDSDKIEIINKKEKGDKHALKNVLIGLGVLLALGGIKPLSKSIKKAGGISNFFKNLSSNPVNSQPVKSESSKLAAKGFWAGFGDKLKKIGKSILNAPKNLWNKIKNIGNKNPKP